MKLSITPSLKKVDLKNFDWECPNLQVTLDIKNDNFFKIKIKELKVNIINDKTEKKEKIFGYINSGDIIVNAKSNTMIILDLVLYNKELLSFLTASLYNKDPHVKVDIAYRLSPIPFKLKMEKNINIFDFLKI